MCNLCVGPERRKELEAQARFDSIITGLLGLAMLALPFAIVWLVKP